MQKIPRICSICGKVIEGEPEQVKSQRGTISYYHRSCIKKEQQDSIYTPQVLGDTLTLEEIDQRVVKSTVEAVIEIGYYLKQIRDRELYKEAGCTDVYEYAKKQYGYDKSVTSRHMSCNDRFSVGGNSPVLAEEYAGYGKSQLQEMVSMPDAQISQVTPDMTVREIKEIKKPRDVSKPVTQEPETKEEPEKDQAPESVATSQQTEAKPEAVAMPQQEITAEPQLMEEAGETIINGEYREVEEPSEPAQSAQEEDNEEASDKTDREIVMEELETEQKYLEQAREAFPEGDPFVRRHELIVSALTEFALKMDQAEGQIQSELPVLKNNDQRKEWLRLYKDWGLWYEDTHIGEKFYKFDFENGARLVAEVYQEEGTKYIPAYESCHLHLIGGPEPKKGNDGLGKWIRHGKYSRYPNSETELVEFLKEMQKGGQSR